MRLVPKNWETFQHYKNRNPPWIKFHRSLLNDRVFDSLPDASRALAPCLWLLASEGENGEFDGSPEELSYRLRRPVEWIKEALKPLIDKGFFVVASGMLASCLQDACLETEREAERETEKELSAAAPPPPEAEPNLFELCLPSFLTRNIAEKEARSLIGALKRDLGSEVAVMSVVETAHRKCDTSSSFRAYLATVSRAEKKLKTAKVAV